jgi:acetylornithine/succinyldiaminopimelate/putrescine aminotransferase
MPLNSFPLTRRQADQRIRQLQNLFLLVGVELKIRAMEVVRGLMARGILTLTAGSTVLRLVPPLVISKDEIDRVVTAIAEQLVEVADDVR